MLNKLKNNITRFYVNMLCLYRVKGGALKSKSYDIFRNSFFIGVSQKCNQYLVLFLDSSITDLFCTSQTILNLDSELFNKISELVSNKIKFKRKNPYFFNIYKELKNE